VSSSPAPSDRDAHVAATASPHRRSVIDEARLCYAAHCEQMLVSYPDLRMKSWDDQDAAVREAWIEHVTPEERSFA
jgi:hypothetical protein